jgi:hypothetical protein
MGAMEMSSGRSPSMDRINTRRTLGTGLGVRLGAGVSVPVAVGSGMSVAVAGAGRVMAGSGVCVSRSQGVLVWQAGRRASRTSKKIVLTRLMSEILPVKAR